MVSSEEESEAKAGDTVEWDVDMEIQLFYAMANHKPVGVNKFFNMTFIWEKLSNSITKEITTRDIWKHLETLYDIQMLDDTEPTPFPNDEVPFSLPESEFGTLMKQKVKSVALAEGNDVTEKIAKARSPSPKTPTPRSSSRGTASKDSAGKSSRKDSAGSSVATKNRKESASSHASTDTPSIKSEKDYDRRRDSRDSNASGTIAIDSSTGRKSVSLKDKKNIKSKVSSSTATPSSEETGSRRGRRRANTSTPPSTAPVPKRRRI